jgi:DNA-binding NtrC family response regulator
MDELTKTRPSAAAEGGRPVWIWKLRVLYTATAGILPAEAKGWEGRAPLTIGRRPTTPPVGCWLLLEDEMTSRVHAKLSLEGQRAMLEDLDSKNGTLVNGRRLKPRERWEIADGDLVQVGDSLLVLRYEPALVQDAENPALVGVSAAMCKLRRDLAALARNNDPVLLLGETGTGKGVAASVLHRRSGRPGKLVEVNCAAIPATLAESMFFGTHRGAFTGAVDQVGFFGEAHQGTLFLDEVGDLPPELQPKLLRALETHQVFPLGSTRPSPCEVPIVAATNQDLEAARQRQTFREDLYARLASSVLHLPPVKQRREDILLLAQHLAGPTFRPSLRLAAAMLRYPWPHNVREIGNTLRQIATHGEEEVCRGLEAARPARREALPIAGPAAPSTQSPSLALSLQPPSRRWQAGDPPPTRRQLVTLLEEFQGNVKRIALEIGCSRRQFGRWAQEHNLDLELYRKQDKAP